ncbi:hypothetical protein jhhlp_002504 [Lomentospora prolificans]|uniref:Uncharacterized protein n=1 Tax=Lomentospora prolificans TaxID=41688 RepID=A0A2N3NEC3_9PEZI|nr:hypothetical protein jhhlp_002504 [Lomentospora prolificans]
MLDRSMYTSNPPVSVEVEEKRKADELHSSAVALARQVYLKQQKLTEQHAEGLDDDENIHSSGDLGHSGPMNLHEAAYELAQERLARLQEEFQRNREFRDRYNPNDSPTPPHHRAPRAFRLRHRSSSDGDLQMRKENRKLSAMTIFPSLQAKVDEEQRRKDREAVLATARRNVQSQLQGIDESIYDRTGKIHPSKLTEWNSRAYTVAQAKVASEMQPRGKRDVGGGMYVAQDQINVVAARNVQPLLKEIDERAENEQERQRMLKEEQAAKQLEAEKQKAHKREVKENYRKLKGIARYFKPSRLKVYATRLIRITESQKQNEKERRQVLKEEQREKRSRAKVLRKEDEEAALRDGIATLDNRILAGTEGGNPRTIEMFGGAQAEDSAIVPPSQTHALPPAVRDMDGITTPRSVSPVEGDSPGDGKEPTLSPGKVKNWIKAKLSRSRASSKTLDESEKGFIGGYAAKVRTPGGSTHSLVPASSMREMAVAGRDRQPAGDGRVTNGAVDDAAGAQLARESSVGSGGSDDRFVDARESQPPAALPPIDRRAVWTPPIGNSRIPGRDSRFREIID